MLRRMKEELTKQKDLNASLRSELDSSRGANSTQTTSRSIPPKGDDEDLGNRLIESQRQNQRLTMDNQDLHRRLDSLHVEVEELKDDLASARRSSDAQTQQVEDLQAEIDRLDSALREALRSDGGDSLIQILAENAALQAENRILTEKINLLLETDCRASVTSSVRASLSSFGNGSVVESLDNGLGDWQVLEARTD